MSRSSHVQVPVTPESRVRFRPLIVHRAPGKAPLLGCPEARRFLEVEERTLEAIAVLQEHSIAQAQQTLHARVGEEYTLVGLVELLRDRGFVASIDEEAVKAQGTRRAWRVPLIDRLGPKHLGWMHHRAFQVVLAAVVLAWVAALVTEPAIRPSGSDFALSARPGLTVLLAFGGIVGVALLHELAHLLAARSFGISGALRVSRRFHVVVLESDVTNAWILPPRSQLGVFLAGMTFNVLAAAVSGLLVFASLRGTLSLGPFTIAALRFFAICNLAPLAYQLLLAGGKTDLYYILVAATGERNLTRDSVKTFLLRSRLLLDRLRRAPIQACLACGSPRRPSAPFCLKCNAAPDGKPSQDPLARRNLRRLTAIGATLVAFRVGGFGFFLFGGAALAIGGTLFGIGLFVGAWQAHDGWGVLEAATVVGVALVALAASAWYVKAVLWATAAYVAKHVKAWLWPPAPESPSADLALGSSTKQDPGAQKSVKPETVKSEAYAEIAPVQGGS